MVVRFGFVVVMCLSAAWVQADTLLGLYGRGGVWVGQFDGFVESGGAGIELEDDLQFEEDVYVHLALALEHGVPLLPNIAVDYTDITSQEEGFVFASFDGVTLSGPVTTEADFSFIDATLYYELLDNWVSLDLGITARVFAGELEITDVTSGETADTDLNDPIPMLYLATRFDLPLSGLAVGGRGKGLAFAGNRLTDFSAYVAYELALGLGLEAGWRQIDLEFDDIQEFDADFDVSGPYAEITVHF